jgi:hypothetical protein
MILLQGHIVWQGQVKRQISASVEVSDCVWIGREQVDKGTDRLAALTLRNSEVQRKTAIGITLLHCLGKSICYCSQSLAIAPAIEKYQMQRKEAVCAPFRRSLWVSRNKVLQEYAQLRTGFVWANEISGRFVGSGPFSCAVFGPL